MHSIRMRFNNYWTRWFRKRALSRRSQRFDSGNLYILPSKFGWSYGLVLLTLFLCAINYQVSSVFFLTFLLVMAGMISAWEAHLNLRGLSVHCVSIDDAHQNEMVKVVLLLTLERKLCYALDYHFVNQEALEIEKITDKGTHITLWVSASERGCFELPRITFFSYFPFGLFRVWGYIYLDAKYYVFPMSVSPGFWPNNHQEGEHNSLKTAGNEELYDLKPVLNPWTQPSLIAWKIAARGQGWYLKTMVNSEGNYWLFRIKDLPAASLEANLQHLCYWLKKAEEQGYLYGLELQGVSTNISQGAAHLTQCLRQLAVY